MNKKKYSHYNIDLVYENKILLYNSLTDKFLIIENFLFELLIASKNEDCIEEINNYHQSFYESLLHNGFIVDKNLDEYEIIKNKIIEVDNNEEEFNIIINPTMNCNFNCWYCYEDHIKDSKMSINTIHKIKLLIDNVIANKKIKKIYLGWFGGEPLLHYEKVMLPILDYAHSISKANNIFFESDITTNGYLIKKEMIANFKEYDLNFFQITLDGNKAKHNEVRFVNKKRGSYEEIIDNIKLLTLHEFSVNVRINFTKDTLIGLDEVSEDLQNCNKEYLSIDMHQVWQTKKDNDRTLDLEFENKIKDIKRKFTLNGYHVNNNDISHYTNSCYADKLNEVVINYNGDIFKCTARDFTKENSLGILDEQGNLKWDNTLYNLRQSAKLNNKPCKECPILPICGSGCSEFAYDHKGEDYCVYDFDLNKKRDLVLNHFQNSIRI